MYDLKCPYCNQEIEIDYDKKHNDDGESEFQDCENCGKTFGFITHVTCIYVTPCQNNGDHKLVDIFRFPPELSTRPRTRGVYSIFPALTRRSFDTPAHARSILQILFKNKTRRS